MDCDGVERGGELRIQRERERSKKVWEEGAI